jgi:hypothetical protein
MIYSTIFECQKALDALDLHSTPYDANYIDDLYSDYTCSDDDFFPETKGAIGKSTSSSLGDSTIIGSGNISDSDFIVNSGIHAGEDDINSLTRGEFEDAPQPPSRMQCMMASQSKANGNRTDGGRDGRTTGGRLIMQAQISRARRVYNGETPFSPNPTEDEVAALRFIISEQKAQIASEKRALERRREEADASSQHRANLTSLYSSGAMQRSRSRSISRDDRHHISRNLEADYIDVDIL